MDCAATFSDGSFICQLGVVFALIRDFFFIVASVLVIIALVVLIMVLLRSYRIVKETSGRVGGILDQVEEGIETVKGALGFLGGLRRFGAGSAAVTGGRSTIRTIGALLRPFGRLASGAARRSARRRGGGDGSES